MILADLHNHTLISHGSASVEEMYAAGKARGLKWMGFAEHSPLPDGFFCALYTGDLAGEFPNYVKSVLKLKNGHDDGPVPLLGLELDWLPSKARWMRELTASAPFDYIYCSLHYLDGVSISRPESWQIPKEKYFERFAAYFYELGGMAASGLAQIASHPDFIKLRVCDDYHNWLKTREARDAIGFALESMKKHDVTMEVNAGGLRWPFAEPYPAPMIMDMAKDIGLHICFGSDAHNVADVARDFNVLADYARAHGFSGSRIFIARQPRNLPF